MRNLLARDTTTNITQSVSDELLNTFGPDALIQAAANRHGDYNEFRIILSEELYTNLKSSLCDEEWAIVSQILSRYGKQGVSNRRWKIFLNAFRSTLPNSVAVDLAEVLVDVLGTNLQPSAILTFNAEPLLYTLVNATIWDRATDGGNRSATKGGARESLNLVTRSISSRRAGKVPYIFCHGLLPVPGQKAGFGMETVDKLVFSETEYLQLANQSFSWQSSSFVDVCSKRRTVFLGVSLSDPNMRRWLSWIHSNRLAELRISTGFKGDSTFHYWLRKHPGTIDEQRWIESTVEHLGVRLVWLDNWNESASTMRSMLRI